MKKFWRYNFLFNIILAFAFAGFFYWWFKLEKSTDLLFSISLICVSLIQLIFSLIISVVKFRKQSFATLVYLFLMGLLTYIQVVIFFGVLTGLTGEPGPLNS